MTQENMNNDSRLGEKLAKKLPSPIPVVYNQVAHNQVSNNVAHPINYILATNTPFNPPCVFLSAKNHAMTFFRQMLRKYHSKQFIKLVYSNTQEQQTQHYINRDHVPIP